MSLFSLKKHRLNKKAMFQKIFNEGNKVFSKSLVLRFIQSPDGEYRMAFIIRKKIGNAVFRNRIRRIIRETVFKESHNFKKQCWLLFSVQEFDSMVDNNTIRESVLFTLKKSGII